MLFACFIIAAARYVAPLDHAELKVHFVRPSKLLERIGALSDENVKADDLRGVLLVEGSAEDIKQIQTLVSAFDVQRRKVSVSVTVESLVDKTTYQVSAKLLNYQEWQTSDGDTGVLVSVTPRINDDNTVTLFMQYGQEKARLARTVLRLKAGSSYTFLVGSDESRQTRHRPEGGIEIKSIPIPVPKITIRPEILD